MSDKEAVIRHIGTLETTVVDLQTRLTALKGLGPENGGEGEAVKAQFLEHRLLQLGCPSITHIDAQDPRVPGGVRPNIAAVFPGHSSRKLWILGHMDLVPPGDLASWKTDPWQVHREGDKLFGRGVEDNQQAIVSGLLAAEALRACDVKPDYSLGLVFVSDEENNSFFGIRHILREQADLFSPEDFIVIPDFGRPDGSWIEISEKGHLWMKIEVTGVQAHGSTPEKGSNALIAASAMILRVQNLALNHPERNELFAPPTSTFTPTRRDANVPNINTVPGKDIFYIDCRLLPGLSSDQILQETKVIMEETAAQYAGISVKVSVVSAADAAKPTDEHCETVRRLTQAVQSVYGITPHCVGIGGGTVAAYFRKKGLPAAVWASVDSTCHMPNEFSRISKTIGDAQVLASMLFD